MNTASHITDEQVDKANDAFWESDYLNGFRGRLRIALEAAFPEPSIQELLRDEERSARHDYPQQLAGLSDERFARCVQSIHTL